MRGSIVRRGKGKWLVRVWLGRTPDGKQRFHNKVVHGTRDDAENYAAERIAEAGRGQLAPTSSITLGQHLDYWLAEVARPRLRTNSFQSYSETLARYVPDDLRQRRIQLIAGDDLERLYRSLVADTGVSGRTARYLHAILRSALRHARLKRRLLVQDPTEAVELPPLRTREMRALTAKEAARLITALRQDDQFGLLLELMLVVGLRPSEAIGLRISDVNLDARTVRVAQRVVHLRKRRTSARPGFDVGTPKSNRSHRTLVLPPYIEAPLREQKQKALLARFPEAEYQEQDLLFPSKAGTPISARNLSVRYFKPALQRAGLPQDIRLYDLRHAHATLLAAAGIPLRVVADQLGHANPHVTVTTYQHVTADMVGVVADVFQKAFGRGN